MPGTSLSTIAAATGVFVSSFSPTTIGTSAHFLYNTTTGLLDFDQDGAGAKAALNIATLIGTPALTAQQFHIVA